MITQAQLQRLYGDGSKQLFSYLKNKHKGGSNNAKGNSFENQFIVFKIAEHFNQRFARNASMNDVQFSSQELCFIDDLIVKNPVERIAEHYQMKDVQSLEWDGSPHAISNDFRMQHAICSDDGETPHLELVVSSEEIAQEMEDNKAEDLVDKVTLHYFPKGESINQLLRRNPEVKAALTDMCALRTPTWDKLETLGTILLGAWCGSSQKGITLEVLLDACHKQSPHYIKGFDSRLSKELKDAMDRITGLDYIVEGGYIRWNYNETDSGVVSHRIGSPEFLDWESAVIIQAANNFEELESYLI